MFRFIIAFVALSGSVFLFGCTKQDEALNKDDSHWLKFYMAGDEDEIEAQLDEIEARGKLGSEPQLEKRSRALEQQKKHLLEQAQRAEQQKKHHLEQAQRVEKKKKRHLEQAQRVDKKKSLLDGRIRRLENVRTDKPHGTAKHKHGAHDHHGKHTHEHVPPITTTTKHLDVQINEEVGGHKVAAKVTFKKGNETHVVYYPVDDEGTELEGCGHKHGAKCGGAKHHHLEADGAKQKAVRSSVWRIDLSKRAEQMPEGTIIHIPPSNDFDSAHVKLIATTEAPAPWGLVD
jgi:vacuolar-type H+-ATPase subunit I/STV1